MSKASKHTCFDGIVRAVEVVVIFYLSAMILAIPMAIAAVMAERISSFFMKGLIMLAALSMGITLTYGFVKATQYKPKQEKF